MSRAFVREQDDPGPEQVPELQVSDSPNLVTPRGLKLIEEKIAALNARVAAKPDDDEMARLQRDLRYWTARHGSARVVEKPTQHDEVAFGSHVTIERDGKPRETIEIVGEDESDPASGRISYVAPLAHALIGAVAGETVDMEGRDPPLRIKVVAVD